MLKLPADVEDNKLSATSMQARLGGEPATHMSSAIHLFKLAKFNSEMKYVLHSISDEVPPYAYPNIPDILQWQRDIAARLKAWFDQIPRFTGNKAYMTKICEIKYHGIMMLLLRPSPAIPSPSVESLKSCYESAVSSLRLYDQLYKSDLLVYSWITVHSIFLATITMLHCIWTVAEITAQVKLDVLMADLKGGSNVLSATGEHWPEAKQSRDALDELSATTVRWIIESKARNTEISSSTHARRSAGYSGSNANGGTTQLEDQSLRFADNQSLGNYEQGQGVDFNQLSALDTNQQSQDAGLQFYTSLFGDENLMDQVDFSNTASVNTFMQRVFTDLQPIYNFGLEFGMDHISSEQF